MIVLHYVSFVTLHLCLRALKIIKISFAIKVLKSIFTVSTVFQLTKPHSFAKIPIFVNCHLWHNQLKTQQQNKV